MASTSGGGSESGNVARSPDHDSLATSARHVLILQGSLMLILAAIVLFYGMWQVSAGSPVVDALASCFGVLLGMASTVLSRRSASRSATAALKTPQFAMLPVYMGLLNKLVIVGGGLAFGLIVLGLEPLYVVAGYVVSQVALVIVMIRSSVKHSER